MTLKKVYFELTRACNLACTHCLNDSGDRLKDELSPEQILALVRDLADFGAQEIRFTGGEPTISPVLTRAIQTATGLGVRTSIGSNAVAIGREKARELADAGLVAAVVSIDGDKESHDAIRGRDSYRRTWRGIRALIGANIRVRVNAVAMRRTTPGLASLAEECQRLGVKLNVRRFIPSGRVAGQVQELLSVQEYKALWESLHAYVERGVVDGHYRTDAPGHCSAGTTGLVILPNGSVQSCGFLSDLGEPSYGNVALEGIRTVWARTRSSSYLMNARGTLHAMNEGRPDLPHSNCLAIAVGSEDALVQLRRKS